MLEFYRSGSAGYTCLHIAAARGHVAIARLIVNHDQDKPLLEAKDALGCTPTYMACQWGHIETLKVLVEAGSNRSAANDAGRTPLMAAAGCGENAVAVVDVLMKDVPVPSPNTTDKHGWTALHYAVSGGHVDITAKLCSLPGTHLNIKVPLAPTPTHIPHHPALAGLGCSHRLNRSRSRSLNVAVTPSHPSSKP